jgi:hypothetical protein
MVELLIGKIHGNCYLQLEMGARTDVTNKLGNTPLMTYFLPLKSYDYNFSNDVLQNAENLKLETYPPW